MFICFCLMWMFDTMKIYKCNRFFPKPKSLYELKRSLWSGLNTVREGEKTIVDTSWGGSRTFPCRNTCSTSTVSKRILQAAAGGVVPLSLPNWRICRAFLSWIGQEPWTQKPSLSWGLLDVVSQMWRITVTDVETGGRKTSSLMGKCHI